MSNVLIIENDEMMRLALASELGRAGIVTQQAANGAEGLEKAKQDHPAVIILDEHMPKMNGQQFMEALEKEAWFKEVHIIVFTSLHDVDLMNHKMLAGVADYLNKGTATPATVVQAVQKYLPPAANPTS